MTANHSLVSRSSRTVVMGLVFTLSVFLAVAQGLAAAQGAHHLQTKAAHANVLCSLICAANQAYQANEAVHHAVYNVLGIAQSLDAHPEPPPELLASSSRAPPSLVSSSTE